jgi:lipoprotein-anchoring transpeptidase ErfK/SrfK
MPRLRRSSARLAAVLAAALAGSMLVACSSSSGGSPGGTITRTVTHSPAAPDPTGSQATSASASPSKPKGPVKTVHVTSLEGDGSVYGVGMPIILYFSPAPTDSTEFTKAVTVTVNGQPAKGAWFWSQPLGSEKKKNIVEAHYRMKSYWPAHATIQVKLTIEGLSAGKGLAYSGKLNSLTFRTGDRHITTVDGSARQGGPHNLSMTVLSNDKVVKTFKVSLGAAKTPTYNGTKVVMQKGEDYPGSNKRRPNGAVRMIGGTGSSRYDEIVNWSVRVTNSGEYIHAAPWNNHLGQLSTSNGCTNMSVGDAEWYYKWAQVGDVVIYSNTGGKKMPTWDGYGGWNMNWNVWKQGGLLLNH